MSQFVVLADELDEDADLRQLQCLLRVHDDGGGGSPFGKESGRTQPWKLPRQISGTMPQPRPRSTMAMQVAVLLTEMRLGEDCR